MPIKILNKKEIKKIKGLIKRQWDAEPELDYGFYLSERNRLYIINKEIADYELSKIRINSIGLYFGEHSNGELRLSMEGAQIVGKYAKKNIVEITDEHTKTWLRGEQLDLEGDYHGFVLIKNKNDILGCGKYSGGRILNYVPKTRRIRSSS